MSGSKWLRPTTLAGIVLLGVFVVCAKAWAWPWEKTERKAALTKLADVMSAPDAYVGREVAFECRFAMQGKLFKHFNTRFNEGEHANFAVWPSDTPFWDKAARRNVLPTLYVDKSDKQLFDAVRLSKRYEKMVVSGRVVSSYAGLPWLLIHKIRKVEEKDEVVTDNGIMHVRHGLDMLAKNKSLLAARHFEMAYESGIPVEQKGFVLKKTGESFQGADNHDKAIAYYTRAAEEDDDDADIQLQLAKLYLKADNPRSALEAGKRCLELSSRTPEAYAVMGEAYGKLGQFSKALEQTELAENFPGISPREKAMAQVHRARILVQAQRFADAVRAYAAAISGDSELSGVAWLRKEIGGLYESRYDATRQIALLDDAEREYANANVLSNNADAEGLYFAARAAFKRSKAEKAGDFAKSKKLLEQALGVNNAYMPAMLMQGEIALAEGDEAGAEKIFTAIAEVDGGNADALLSLATTYEKIGKNDQAYTIYKKVIAIDPMNRGALEKFAEMAEARGDLKAASDAYVALAKAAPGETSYQYKAGRALLQMGDYSGAASALSVAAGAPGPMGTEAAVLQARALVLAGQGAQAESVLRQVLSGSPGNAEANAALSKILSDRNQNPAEALQLAQNAVAADGTNPVFQDTLAWAMIRSGDHAGALRVLGGMDEVNMTRAVWYHKALAQYFAGDFAGARVSIQQVLQPMQVGEIQAEVEALQEKAKELQEKVINAETQAQREAIRKAREDASLQVETAMELEGQAVEENAAGTAMEAVQENDEGLDELFPVEEIETDVIVPMAEAKSAGTTVSTASADTIQPTAVEKVLENEFFDIPGVMMPSENEDISTMAPAAPKERLPESTEFKVPVNQIRNLPIHNDLDVRNMEMKQDIKALIEIEDELDSINPSRPIDEPMKLAPAAEEPRAIAPAAPEAEIFEAPELVPVPAPAPSVREKKADLPRNDVSDLPDWAM